MCRGGGGEPIGTTTARFRWPIVAAAAVLGVATLAGLSTAPAASGTHVAPARAVLDVAVVGPRDEDHSANPGVTPVLLARAGTSGVVFVLLSSVCGRHTCFRLERTSDGGRSFSRVQAPPIAGALPTGNLAGLDFANPRDGVALTWGRGSVTTTLFATFDGARALAPRVDPSGPARRVDGLHAHRVLRRGGNVPEPEDVVRRLGDRSEPGRCRHVDRSTPPVRHRAHAPSATGRGVRRRRVAHRPTRASPYHSLLAISRDDGRTFSVSVQPALSSVNGCSLTPESPSIIWAQCDAGNMRGAIGLSLDGGSRWTAPSIDRGGFAWGVFDPASRDTAFFENGLEPGKIYRFDVGNERVSAVGRTPSLDLSALLLLNANAGLALSGSIGPSNRRILYRTDDGGVAWRRVTI